MSLDKVIKIRITEDPEAEHPLTFYDVQSQIFLALNQYKQNYKMKGDPGEGDEVKCSIADNSDLLEALEFKIKRDL